MRLALSILAALVCSCASAPKPTECLPCPECKNSYWSLPCWDYLRLPDGGAGELVPVPCTAKPIGQ